MIHWMDVPDILKWKQDLPDILTFELSIDSHRSYASIAWSIDLTYKEW